MSTLKTGALRGTSGTADTMTLHASDGSVEIPKLKVGSDAAGDVLYHNGTNYVRLAKGTDGQVLKLASGVPTWADSVSNSPSIAVTRNSAWGIASNPWYLIPYNQTLWNVGGGTWTAASNGDADGSYYTLPSDGAGKYCVSFGIGVENLDDGEILQMRIAKNGGTTGTWAESLSLTASNVRIQSAATDYRQFVNNTLVIELAGGDKIQPQVQHEEGAGQYHVFMNSLSSAHFSMFRLAGV